MAHNRKLVIGGSSVVVETGEHPRKLRHLYKKTLPAMEAVQDEVEKLMIETGYLHTAPFKFVSLIVREGLKDDKEPSYMRQDKKTGSFDATIEIDVHHLIDQELDQIISVYRQATLRSLIPIGIKYGLPVEQLELRLECETPPGSGG